MQAVVQRAKATHRLRSQCGQNLVSLKRERKTLENDNLNVLLRDFLPEA
jgi:hypothetical protein